MCGRCVAKLSRSAFVRFCAFGAIKAKLTASAHNISYTSLEKIFFGSIDLHVP